MLSLSWHNRAKTIHSGTKKALAINAKCLIYIAYLVEPGAFEPDCNVPVNIGFGVPV